MLNNPITTTTYWSGKKKLIFDLFWCVLLAGLITVSNPPAQINQYDYFAPHNRTEFIFDVVFSFISRILLCFFLFFFWSWKKEHVRDQFVRSVIHVFCWTFFIVTGILCFSICLLPWILPNNILLSISLFFILIAFLVLLVPKSLALLVTKRYSKLMSPENPDYYVRNSIKRACLYLFKCGKWFIILGMEKFWKAKPFVRYIISAFILCLLLYLLFGGMIGLESPVVLPFILLTLLIDKTVWLYIFLFWFSWNLLSILRSLNDTWKKSLQKNPKRKSQ